MCEGARNTLQQALRDLDDGMRALLGQQPVRLGIVRELLGAKSAHVRCTRSVLAKKSQARASHPSSPLRRRAHRRPGQRLPRHGSVLRLVQPEAPEGEPAEQVAAAEEQARER